MPSIPYKSENGIETFDSARKFLKELHIGNQNQCYDHGD